MSHEENLSVDVSLVVPLYDEAENVEDLVASCLSALAGVAESYELILVDDGSTDDTCRLLENATKANPHVRAVSLRRRFGACRRRSAA